MKELIEACGCCEGVEILTPLPTANRPGLAALSYRVGTHATFLETMLARLSSSDYPKLRELSTRDPGDPAIAVLDAWATVADVLTFYQERIANEGYLRTATERRSVLELARLVGYKLRPGVASSVYLAYTLDDNSKDEVVVPKGARAQSVPGPGELPQSFEISEDLKARARWNNLRPRITQPQTEESIRHGDGVNAQLYLKGISTNLKPNDPLLIDFGTGSPEFHRVREVNPDAVADWTLVILQSSAITEDIKEDKNGPLGLIEALTLPPSVQPDNSLKLGRKLEDQFEAKDTATAGDDDASLLRRTLTSGEASYAALSAFAPELREVLATAAANAEVTRPSEIKVYALRTKAALFGHNYLGIPVSFSPTIGIRGFEGLAAVPTGGNAFLTLHIPVSLGQLWPAELVQPSDKGLAKIALDPQNEQLQKGGWMVIERPNLELSDCKVTGRTHSIHSVLDVQQITMSGRQDRNFSIGFSSKVNLLTVDKPWLADLNLGDQFAGLLGCIPLLRETTAYTQSEELELAEEPIEDPVCGGTNQLIELDDFYEGLEAGRWVVVSGEREIGGTIGVRFSELAMLSAATQKVRMQSQPTQTGVSSGTILPTPLPGDKTHSFITLAQSLAYCFKRDTVTIYGNVVNATHGETRKEVLGSGDGAKVLQAFTLKQPPLTFVSASNPSGVDSTLKVFVSDIEWHETDSLAGLSSTGRNFITKTDDEGKTTVIFGNGKEGARLPTGIENIKSEYRNGIGRPGNVKATQISLLVTRPLGVKEVINPLRASGGADKEGRDQARKNAPLAVKALDRLVSVQDYADFARTYAGIGKARAEELSDSRRQLVHVTIAGADDIPIDETSDLFRNLRQALQDYGDPFQPIQLAVRELKLVVLSARVRILPDYQWEPVVTQLRAALLDAFSFERRELGHDVLLSTVISVMQGVRGVAYVDADAFGGVPEKKVVESGERRLLTPKEIAKEVQDLVDASKAKGRPEPRLKVNLADFEQGVLRPAQLAFMTPDVPATLILNQIT